MKDTFDRLFNYAIVKIKELWREDSAPRRKRSGSDPQLLSIEIPAGRSRFIFGMIFFAMCIVFGRAMWLQCGFSTEFLQKQGEARYSRNIVVNAPRGQILDRNGVVLASSVPSRSIWAVPDEVLQNASTEQIKNLSDLIGMSQDKIRQRLEKRRGKRFVYLMRQMEIEQAELVRALRIPGLYVGAESRRNYPDGEISAHVVGFTDSDGEGREGVELASNKQLSGVRGYRRVIRDRLGRVVEDLEGSPARPGHDIVLSIDSRLQFIAHNALRRAIDRSKAKAGAVVVADVHTGEILALSNWPTYDPNVRRSLHFENVRNRVFTDAFEPGSTLKPFAVARALDIGIVEPDVVVETAPGKMTIGDRTIGDTHNYGKLTVSQVVSKSSNIGTAKIALELPPQLLWQTYDALGFGRVPNLSFPGSTGGRLRPASTWRPIEQATISYGHGISVSLIQLVRAYTALARNGDVIDLTLRRTGKEVTGKQIFRPEVARQMRQMMMDTVRTGGTARAVSVQGYTIAGKTGTAMKIENGQYVEKYVASFVGMAPASQPRLIVAVMVDEPSQGSHFGGTVSAPVFNEVTAGALRLIGVHPDAPGISSGIGIMVKGIRND